MRERREREGLFRKMERALKDQPRDYSRRADPLLEDSIYRSGLPWRAPKDNLVGFRNQTRDGFLETPVGEAVRQVHIGDVTERVKHNRDKAPGPIAQAPEVAAGLIADMNLRPDHFYSVRRWVNSTGMTEQETEPVVAALLGTGMVGSRQIPRSSLVSYYLTEKVDPLLQANTDYDPNYQDQLL